MIAIGILENNLLLPAGFQEGFEASAEFRLLFCCWGLESLEVEWNRRCAAPDVVLVETGRVNVVRIIKGVKAFFPTAKILVLSPERSDEAVREALSLGVQGYLTPDLSFEELAVQVRRIHEGHPVLPKPVLWRVLEFFHSQPVTLALCDDPELTPRENDIARCLCRGLTYKQIGKELNLSVFTVNQHLKKMYLKKGVNSRHELACKMSGRN
jgi:DNA-binding NarL/FixJ family response regulator